MLRKMSHLTVKRMRKSPTHLWTHLHWTRSNSVLTSGGPFTTHRLSWHRCSRSEFTFTTTSYHAWSTRRIATPQIQTRTASVRSITPAKLTGSWQIIKTPSRSTGPAVSTTYRPTLITRMRSVDSNKEVRNPTSGTTAMIQKNVCVSTRWPPS